MAVSPQAINIKFGSELRKLREEADLTQRQLARAVHLSQGQISALERGTKGTTEEQVLRLDKVLNAEGVLLRRWQDGRSRGRGFAAWFADDVAVEEEAHEIRQYHPTLIPGLLQTEAYARAIIRSGMPPDSDQEINELVQGRIRRQKILAADHPPWYRVVLDEPWLHRPSGGPDTMRDQLEALIKASLLPRVTIQVIPTDTKYHSGHDGGFKLIMVDDKGEVVYLETLHSGTSWDDPDVVNKYKKVFGELRGAALPEEASRELLKSVMGEFE